MSHGFTVTPVLAEGGLGPWLPILFVIIMVVNALISIRKAQRQKQEHEVDARGADDEQRARETRERVRRMIAERRGEAYQPEREGPEPAQFERPRPAPPTLERRPIDPFGGNPLGRMLEELERKLQPPEPPVETPRRIPPPPVPVPVPAMAPVMARLAVEQTPELITEGPVAPMSPRSRVAPGSERRANPARERLMTDLADPEGLRRAFVLREVLGPPVSMRR